MKAALKTPATDSRVARARQSRMMFTVWVPNPGTSMWLGSPRTVSPGSHRRRSPLASPSTGSVVP